MIIANMASFPARYSQMKTALASISGQMDGINLVLNEYKAIPRELSRFQNLNPILPQNDLKDLGKFSTVVEEGHDLFLVDDDIEYPADYVSTMVDHRCRLAAAGIQDPILGLHSIIYSDFFDGRASARNVSIFDNENTGYRLVNQVGTGTVYCKSDQMPPFSHMAGSERYVDVRFAAWAYDRQYPLINVPRPQSWLKQIEVESSIFSSFTVDWPAEVVREVNRFGGYCHLDLATVKRLNGMKHA